MSSNGRSSRFSFFDLPSALWYFLGPERWRFLVFSGILLIVLCYTMVPPYIIGLTTNFLIGYVKADSANRSSISPLFWFAGLLSGSYAVVALIRLSSKRMLGRISLNARYRAKVSGFERLLDSSLSWHQQESTGNKAQRLLTGAEAVREWTGDIIIDFLNAVAVFGGSLIAGTLLHPAFILFFVYYLGVLVGTERYFDRRIDRLSDRINQSLENASGGFFESASNILSVKALGATDSMTNSLAQREELARRLSYERLRLANTKWMCYQIHNAVSWGIYLLAVANMVIQGKLLPGFFLTYATYFDKLREAATGFTDRFQVMIERKSNLSRMMPLFWTDNRLPTGNREFPLNWTSIQIRDAVFHYDNKPAVGPLSLEVKRGEIVGIAGKSGSGKSTLIKLLLGLYHLDRGTLQIGDVPVREIRHEELISNIAVVLQETELFNFSLRENITMMRDVSPAFLQRSCDIACLSDVIARLPDGLDSLIGERGYSLSGGERQRLGIARAVCRNAPILLLDEATSALDSATEQIVMKRLIAQHSADRTMLIIAHRISTLKDAHKVFVFDEGLLVEQGGFQELVEDPESRFGMMSAIQSVGADDSTTRQLFN
jgi:ABC-type multidrug transport system fused ATPase/permease subunit